MRKFFMLGFVIGLLSIVGISALPNSPNYSPSDCAIDHVPITSESFKSGVMISNYKICYQLETKIPIFSQWENDKLIQVRNASLDETLILSTHQTFIAKQAATLSIESDIESGKKIVEILKSWELEGLENVLIWDTFTSDQKDSVLKEFIRRTSIFYGRFADYLITQNYAIK